MTETIQQSNYDRAASTWGERVTRIGYLHAYRAFARACLPKSDTDAQYCDIGTGCGTFAVAALHSAKQPAGLTLVDPSAGMLACAVDAVAGKAGTISCHQIKVEDFSPNQKFDVILAAHVLEHCKSATQALTRMYSLLAPGGALLLVISRPHWCQWIIWLRWRHRWFSKQTVCKMAAVGKLPTPNYYHFASGPPQRTSFGYCFRKPINERT